MSSRALTGLLLIIGSILIFVGFAGFGIGMGEMDWANAASMVTALGENAGLVQTFIPIAVLGFIAVAAGLAGLNHSMAGGSGSHYARLGSLVYVMGITVGLVEFALLFGIADVANDGQAAAETLYTASQAVGAGGSAIWFLGLGVIGVSIFVQRNLPTILACLMVLVGIIGIVLAMVDYNSDLMIIPFISALVVTLATGVLFIRAED